MKTKSFLYFLALLLLISCKSNLHEYDSKNISSNSSASVSQDSNVYNQAAIEICQCMHPMVEKAQGMEQMLKTNSKVLREREEQEFRKIQAQVKNCSAALRKKYSTMEQNLMLQALKKYCYESYVIINKGVNLAQN